MTSHYSTPERRAQIHVIKELSFTLLEENIHFLPQFLVTSIGGAFRLGHHAIFISKICAWTWVADLTPEQMKRMETNAIVIEFTVEFQKYTLFDSVLMSAL